MPVSVAGVVTQPDRPSGRGRRLTSGPVKAMAERAGVTVLQPERVRSAGAVSEVLDLRPDVIVVASYGQILPASLLDAPAGRAMNLHPSLLPLYRGPAPIAAPILAGDSVTGVTLMLMSPRMDAGPILDQRRVPIEPDETAGDLAARLAEESAALLLEDLPAWLEGEIEPRSQDEEKATYTERIAKDDGIIDWSVPAGEVARKVRAFTPWPGAYTTWAGRPIMLLSTSVEDGSAPPGEVLVTDRGELAVGTARGTLVIQRLQPAGGKPMSAEAFLRGHPSVAGDVLGR